MSNAMNWSRKDIMSVALQSGHRVMKSAMATSVQETGTQHEHTHTRAHTLAQTDSNSCSGPSSARTAEFADRITAFHVLLKYPLPMRSESREIIILGPHLRDTRSRWDCVAEWARVRGNDQEPRAFATHPICGRDESMTD
jgi:hypothetical protein